MKPYRVRDGFWLHFADARGVVAPGTVIELSDDDAALHALRVEPVEPTKPAKAAKGA